MFSSKRYLTLPYLRYYGRSVQAETSHTFNRESAGDVRSSNSGPQNQPDRIHDKDDIAAIEKAIEAQETIEELAEDLLKAKRSVAERTKELKKKVLRGAYFPGGDKKGDE